MNFERIKRFFGLPDQEEYPVGDPSIEPAEHDENNPNCMCPDCFEAFLQRCNDKIINGD